MILLLTFAAFFVAGQAANLTISVMVEEFSKSASLAVFFVLFAVVVVGAWQLALRVTEARLGKAESARGR